MIPHTAATKQTLDLLSQFNSIRAHSHFSRIILDSRFLASLCSSTKRSDSLLILVILAHGELQRWPCGSPIPKKNQQKLSKCSRFRAKKARSEKPRKRKDAPLWLISCGANILLVVIIITYRQVIVVPSRNIFVIKRFVELVVKECHSGCIMIPKEKELA